MPKTNYKDLEKKLTRQKQNAWEVWDEKTAKQAFAFAEGYKKFLNLAKTERETVAETVKLARAAGAKNLADLKSVKAGDLIYSVNREKSVIFSRLGSQGLKNGIKLLMAHADSPRLDLKGNPLYEEENAAFLKTHYYGGIKKYQWTTIALALHGVVYLSDGREVEVKIGEKETDPVFMITDLAPHLDRPAPFGQSKNREVQGEDLNLVVGSMPVKDKNIKEKIKLALLEYLYKEYGLKEEDFNSAEISAVPSEKARDLGFDRSLISAYGHDDRSCVFAAMESILAAKTAKETQVCILVDREEIGSEGNAGARSMFIELFFSRLNELLGNSGGLEKVYEIYAKSNGLSTDVNIAVDPDYKDVQDLRNAARIGGGVMIEKYTGHGGKYGTSEASGRLVAKLRQIFSENKNIVYQVAGAIGKVDLGGGGTIAKYMASRGLDMVDVGLPVFNTHAPLEIASKADLYCAYLGYKAFLES